MVMAFLDLSFNVRASLYQCLAKLAHLSVAMAVRTAQLLIAAIQCPRLVLTLVATAPTVLSIAQLNLNPWSQRMALLNVVMAPTRAQLHTVAHQ